MGHCQGYELVWQSWDENEGGDFDSMKLCFDSRIFGAVICLRFGALSTAEATYP